MNARRTSASRDILFALLGFVAACAATPSHACDHTALQIPAAAHIGCAESPSALFDPRSLGDLIGQARLVSLGEAEHDTEEMLALRNGLFAVLVEHFGFTAIAVETGFTEATLVDDYVSGAGELSGEIVRAAFSFAAPAAHSRNAELIEWMRNYNSRPYVRRRVRFYGIEMIGGEDRQDRPLLHVPLRAALSYVEGADPPEGWRLSRLLTPLLDRLSTAGYEGMTREFQELLGAASDELIASFGRQRAEWISRTSAMQFERGLRNAMNASHAIADQRAGGWWTKARRDLNRRDAWSAQNVQWILEQEGPSGRILLFAHNDHVRKRCCTHPPFQYVSAGQHLRQALGLQIVVIGTVVEPSRTAWAMVDLQHLPAVARRRLDACDYYDAVVLTGALTRASPYAVSNDNSR